MHMVRTLPPRMHMVKKGRILVFQDGGLEGGCISCCSRTQDSKEEILRNLGSTQSSRVSLSSWGGVPDGTVVPEHRECYEVELPGETPLPPLEQ